MGFLGKFGGALIVAPHAGAWIEIRFLLLLSVLYLVAPHAGAWIEISGANSPAKLASVAPHAGSAD